VSQLKIESKLAEGRKNPVSSWEWSKSRTVGPHYADAETDESGIAPMLDGMVNPERVHCAKVEKGVSGSTRDLMTAEPNPSNWEVLAGMVERVTYQNVENGFCVIRVKARGHRELVTVVGHAAAISAGEWVTATGEWLNDRTHGQ
jgi:hypothetical protein